MLNSCFCNPVPTINSRTIDAQSSCQFTVFALLVLLGSFRLMYFVFAVLAVKLYGSVRLDHTRCM
jgi:hypothetical protein